VAELVEQVSALETAMEQVGRHREAANAELASTQQQLAERTKQLEGETATREAKEAELASTQQQLAQRTEQLEGETAAHAAKEAELASTQQQLKERTEQLANVVVGLATAQQQLAERTKQLESAIQAKESTEAEIASMELQLSQRTEQLQAETAGREASVTAQLAAAQQQLAERTKQLESAIQAKETKEAELTAVTLAIQRQLTDIMERQREKADSLREDARAQAREETHKALQAAEAAARKLETELAAQSHELQSARHEHASALQSLAQVRAEVEDLRRSLAQAQPNPNRGAVIAPEGGSDGRLLTEAQANLVAVMAENEQLQSVIAELKRALTGAQEELALHAAEALVQSDIASERFHELRLLSVDNERLRTANAALASKVEISVASETSAGLEHEASSLRSELADKEATIARLRKDQQTFGHTAALQLKKQAEQIQALKGELSRCKGAA
jgi:chromosome segregation ATPase